MHEGYTGAAPKLHAAFLRSATGACVWSILGRSAFRVLTSGPGEPLVVCDE
jgi:hypothetical protein